MATWIAHLRLAEALLNKGFTLDRTQFAIGNIAPDCGIPDDNGNFSPPSSVTHFAPAGQKANGDAFYKQYLQNQTYEPEKYAFMLGYYAHLIADEAWSELVYRPKKVTSLWAEGLEGNPEFIWEIKKDWYGLDFIYLNENPDCLFFSTFLAVEEVSDTLDFVPDGNFTKTVKRIQAYYQDKENMELSLAHEYRYLSKDEMEAYLQETQERIISAFEEIGISTG